MLLLLAIFNKEVLSVLLLVLTARTDDGGWRVRSENALAISMPLETRARNKALLTRMAIEIP